MVPIEQFNADWLAAWSDKDVERVLSFYDPKATYQDPQVPGGLTGHEALRDYLAKLFASLPTTLYTPDEVWPLPGGFCGRWYCAIGDDGAQGRLRGFDFVQLNGDRIIHNEVYVHPLPAA
jgi:hypothetical protein